MESHASGYLVHARDSFSPATDTPVSVPGTPSSSTGPGSDPAADTGPTAMRRLWRQVPVVLLALLPLSLAVHGRAKVVAPAVLFFFGLWVLARRGEVRACCRRAWPVMATAGLVVVFAIASCIGHGLGWSALDGAGHVLMYLVIAAVFATGLDMRVVRVGFSLTAVAFGIVCIVQHFGLDISRAYSLDGGTSTAIEFATVMLGLALLALVQLLRARRGPVETFVHGAGVALGMYGALLTQSRGPLLALVPVLLGLLVLYARTSGRWWRGLGLLAVFVIGGLCATASVRGGVMERFTAIGQQIDVARAGEVDGSLSARMEMWRTATRALVDHPWAGLGADGFQDFMRAEVAAGRTDPAVARYNNPHNMYLGAAADGGVPGLLVLLLMFAVPIVFFARHLGAADEGLATSAWSGLAVCVLYALCAVTDSVFYRVMTESFYYLLVLGLAAHIGWKLRTAAAARGLRVGS